MTGKEHGFVNEALDASDTCTILYELSKLKKDSGLIGLGYMIPARTISSKPVFDIIPEESETTSLVDFENGSIAEGEHIGESSKERVDFKVAIFAPTTPDQEEMPILIPPRCVAEETNEI